MGLGCFFGEPLTNSLSTVLCKHHKSPSTCLPRTSQGSRTLTPYCFAKSTHFGLLFSHSVSNHRRANIANSRRLASVHTWFCFAFASLSSSVSNFIPPWSSASSAVCSNLIPCCVFNSPPCVMSNTPAAVVSCRGSASSSCHPCVS